MVTARIDFSMGPTELAFVVIGPRDWEGADDVRSTLRQRGFDLKSASKARTSRSTILRGRLRTAAGSPPCEQSSRALLRHLLAQFGGTPRAQHSSHA